MDFSCDVHFRSETKRRVCAETAENIKIKNGMDLKKSHFNKSWPSSFYWNEDQCHWESHNAMQHKMHSAGSKLFRCIISFTHSYYVRVICSHFFFTHINGQSLSDTIKSHLLVQTLNGAIKFSVNLSIINNRLRFQWCNRMRFFLNIHWKKKRTTLFLSLRLKWLKFYFD